MKKFVFIAFLGMVFASCNTGEIEFNDLKIDPLEGIYPIPLGYRTYTIRELIDDLQDAELDLQEDTTSLLSLNYVETISYNTEGEFIDIDNITGEGQLTNLTPLAGPVVQEFNQEFQQSYDPQDDEELDSVYYETGNLNLTVNSNANATIDYTVTFENTFEVTDQSTPISFTGTIAGTGTDNQTRNLANHVTKLFGATNDFIVDFTVDVNLGAAQSLIGTEEISFDFTFADQTFNLIYGKFGQDSVQVGNQTLDIEFFNDMGEEGIFFGNPTMTFDFTNTFGIPIGVDLSTVYGFNPEDGSNQIFMSGTITESPLPEIAPAEVPGQAATSSFEVNNSNSNIVELLSTSPSQLVFDVRGISNSNDLDNSESNFVQPGNQIDGTIQLEVPMELRLENLEQSFGFSLGDNGVNINDVDSAYIRLVTINEFPFSGIMALEIQDDEDNTLFRVADNLVMNAPFINVNGLVTDPSGTSIDVPISQDGIEALSQGTKITVIMTLNTPVTQTSRDIFVKILADYQLEIKVGLGILANIDI